MGTGSFKRARQIRAMAGPPARTSRTARFGPRGHRPRSVPEKMLIRGTLPARVARFEPRGPTSVLAIPGLMWIVATRQITGGLARPHMPAARGSRARAGIAVIAIANEIAGTRGIWSITRRRPFSMYRK
ncbi:hypothetical protein IBTHAUMO2_170035 [Nitrosopumilaceae archaeon]|nr:hypothetical protein IBTHAUMO2_170035 [Nitrosopumilaceae archaeon]